MRVVGLIRWVINNVIAHDIFFFSRVPPNVIDAAGGMTNYHIGPYRTTSDPIGLKWHHIGPHRPELAPHWTFGPQYATITYFVVYIAYLKVTVTDNRIVKFVGLLASAATVLMWPSNS